MITLLIILAIVAGLSIAANVALIYYSKSILKRLNVASHHATSIFTNLDGFKEHLEHLYSLTVYHKDENIRQLIVHTGQMIEFIKQYEPIYSWSQPDLEELLAQEGFNEQYELADEEETPQKKEGEALLHSGPSGRNRRVYTLLG